MLGQHHLLQDKGSIIFYRVLLTSASDVLFKDPKFKKYFSKKLNVQIPMH